MQPKPETICFWRQMPERDGAYCHLFHDDCAHCVFRMLDDLKERNTSEDELLPRGYSVSGKHLWVAPSRDHRLLIGADRFLADACFHIRSIIQPQANADIRVGVMVGWIIDLFGTIPLYAPVSGHIVLRNPQLLPRPNLVRDHPYGRGWLFEVIPSNNWRVGLLDTTAGRRNIQKAKHLLKDKIVADCNSGTQAGLIADGGTLSLVDVIQNMPALYLKILLEVIESPAVDEA